MQLISFAQIPLIFPRFDTVTRNNDSKKGNVYMDRKELEVKLNKVSDKKFSNFRENFGGAKKAYQNF